MTSLDDILINRRSTEYRDCVKDYVTAEIDKNFDLWIRKKIEKAKIKDWRNDFDLFK